LDAGIAIPYRQIARMLIGQEQLHELGGKASGKAAIK